MRFLLIALVVLTPASAEAAVFEMDLYDNGDALITRDTDLGLDWLDVSLTVGLGGVSSVLGGAGGWVDAGWRLPSTAEVCSFFTRVSSNSLMCPGTTYESGNFGIGLAMLSAWARRSGEVSSILNR